MPAFDFFAAYMIRAALICARETHHIGSAMPLRWHVDAASVAADAFFFFFSALTKIKKMLLLFYYARRGAARCHITTAILMMRVRVARSVKS